MAPARAGNGIASCQACHKTFRSHAKLVNHTQKCDSRTKRTNEACPACGVLYPEKRDSRLRHERRCTHSFCFPRIPTCETVKPFLLFALQQLHQRPDGTSKTGLRFEVSELDAAYRVTLSYTLPDKCPYYVEQPAGCRQISNWSAIYRAVQECDFLLVEAQLRADQSILSTVDEFGVGLLAFAAEYTLKSKGSYAALAMYRKLLSYRCPQFPNEIGSSPLHVLMDGILLASGMGRASSALHGMTEGELEQSYTRNRELKSAHKALIARREPADVSRINEIDAYGRSALSLAVEYQHDTAVDKLLRVGADPNMGRVMQGKSCPILHLAVAGPASIIGNGYVTRLAMVEKLLAAGAELCVQDDDDWTALHVAASWGSKDLYSYLLRIYEDQDIAIDDLRTNEGYTPAELLRRYETSTK